MEITSGGTVGLVVAAGRGERAGGSLPKQYRRIAGEALVARAAAALLNHSRIDAVAVVVVHVFVADHLSTFGSCRFLCVQYLRTAACPPGFWYSTR